MSLINHYTKEINVKIVYYGPGLGGKTTNIQHIYKDTCKDSKSELISLNTENERTLFFDFLPLELGEIRGHKTKFHLYTVPGQTFYEASRKLILRGVDGIVFVADSQIERLEENIKSYEDMVANLKEQGTDINKLPIVFQWNKRDLPNIVPVDQLEKRININGRQSINASAVKGEGVFETLKKIGKEILLTLGSSMSN